jgi:hypothetical protein
MPFEVKNSSFDEVAIRLVTFHTNESTKSVSVSVSVSNFKSLHH